MIRLEPRESDMSVPEASQASDWTTADGDTTMVPLGHNCFSIQLTFTLLTLDTSGDELDIFVQTYLHGRWTDILQQHYANADDGTTPTVILNHKWNQTTEVGVTPLDKATANDTVDASIPLGSMLRFHFNETVDATFTVTAKCRTWEE